MKNFIFFIVLFCVCFSAHASDSSVISIKPIKKSLIVRGTGRVQLTLDKQKLFDINTKSKYYQGRVKIGKKIFPASASEINGVFSTTFPGKITGSRQSRQRVYTIKYSSRARISSVPTSATTSLTCGEEDSHIVKSKSSAVTTSTTQNVESVKIITISTYADAEWRQTYGTYYNDEIASIINTAETIYNSQLGLRFRILSQQDYESSIDFSPGKILSTFRDSITNSSSANIKHLFTGKDMDGATVGIAYIGAVCYSPDYAFGVTQQFGSLTSNIFAHEVGHNLNARHDYYSPGSVMYPSISFGSPAFSDTSVYEINSFLSYFGSCLNSADLPPLLWNSRLSITNKKNVVSITFLSEKGIPLDNQKISYRVGKSRIVTKITNSQGIIKIKIRTKGSVKIKAFLQSDPTISIERRLIIR